MTMLNDAILIIRKRLTARPQFVSDGYVEEMCMSERRREECLMQVVRPGKFQCECEDILDRVYDYIYEYKALPLGVFMSEVATEIESLREQNFVLRAAVGDENRANRMTELYKSAKQQVDELVRKNQDLHAYAEQDSCMADNLRDELSDIRWKLMHVIYCPDKKKCPTCIQIEEQI